MKKNPGVSLYKGEYNVMDPDFDMLNKSDLPGQEKDLFDD